MNSVQDTDSPVAATVPPTADREKSERGKININPPAAKLSQNLPDVKDKGYAWLVVAAMFLSNIVTAGYIKSFGVFYNNVVLYYPGTSAAAGGAMMALLAGCRSIMAPVVGAAAVQFGYRPVMMFGVLLCSTGLLSSYFCNSIPALAVTLGAMMGTGMCSIETCQIIVLSDYFSDKKELANSLRVSGNPLGGATLPFFLVLLFEHFGLKLTYIILAALFVQLSVLVFLVRPYKLHQKIVMNRRIKNMRGANSSYNEAELETFELQQDGEQPKNEKTKKFDLKLFANPLYITHIFMIIGLSIALPQVQYFVPIFGRSINLSPKENSIILATQAITDSFYRLLIGFLLDKKLFKKTHCFSVCLTIGGVAICVIPFCVGLWTILPTIVIFSIGSAGFFANINVILIDQFGKNNVASSWGFIRMIQGIVNFAYPSLLGLMVDLTGTFWLTFFTMGVGMMLGGFCIAMQPCVARAAKMDVTFL